MGKLTARAVQSIAKPGMYGDGNTLYLNIAARGTKSWIQRVTIAGKRRDIGLGPCSRVPLAAARREAASNLLAIAAGGDPLADKRRRRVPTFQEAARRTWEGLRPSWRDGTRTAAIWWSSIERYALPSIGRLPIDQVTREEVLAILTPIWAPKRVTARKLRQRIRATFAWAQAHGYVDVNMAGEVIDGALPAMRAGQQQHYRAPKYREVPAILAAVEASEAAVVTRLCFRFLVLTSARSGEARGATWAEIDRRAREWRIPDERMKTGVQHVVPLTGAALQVLDAVAAIHDGSDLVFPSPARPGQPLSDNTLSKLLRDLGIDAVPHGFRAAFRTWAEEETDAPHAVMERALAHAVAAEVERAYARGELIAKRRKLMEQWASHVGGGDAEVDA